MNIYNCIIISGNGYPTEDCRRLLSNLQKSLQIPCLGLFDYNPHGLSIFFTYKFGGASMYNAEAFACKDFRWMGLMSADIEGVPPQYLVIERV